MSQVTKFDTSTILRDIETITGNSGGAVGPDGAGNVNIVGTETITVVGNPGTNTLTVTPLNEIISTVQTMNAVATDIFAITIDEDTAITLEVRIVGAKADYSASIGGTLTVIARRETAMATILGATSAGVIEDSGTGNPIFDAVISGNDLVIQVTGEAGITYNWKARTSYDVQDT